MKRRSFLVAGLTAAVIMLGGCVVLEPLKSNDELVSSDAGFGPPLTSFFVSGRLALRQGERSDFLKFDWQHDSLRDTARDTVLLLSPLGQGIAEIVVAEGGARLLRPGEAPVEAADIASLTRQMLGTEVPLQELGNWLRGARGVSGEIDGWSIVVMQTVAHPTFATGRLPRRLEARRGDVVLTLIVDDWTAAEATEAGEKKD